MNPSHVSTAKLHFRYLIDEFNFAIIREEIDSDYDVWLVYSNDFTILEIITERGSLSAGLGRAKDIHKKESPLISWRTVYQYQYYSVTERELILSHNPADDDKAGKLLYAENMCGWKKNSNRLENLENQIAFEAENYKKYCADLLRGKFSMWLEYFEFKVDAQRAEFARKHGKEDMVSEMGFSSDGKLVEKRKKTMWQDYLAELRQEYGK